ncbi:gata transcription factor [Musa troglodytarum]|uniref:Gata transcription factor n=2 Tax=Musa troglodytarum TaxID=320322 RepID=A0A9E7F563_9LILI|nr:gata transcription factor [Musa troglodytarum]
MEAFPIGLLLPNTRTFTMTKRTPPASPVRERGYCDHMEDVMGDLFEHIDDLLDFPDDVLGLVEPCNQSAHLFLPAPPVPACAEGLLGGVGDDSLDGSSSRSHKSGAAFSPAEDKLGPCDELDVLQLEWMSKFLDDSDSFPLDLPCCNAVTNNGNGENSDAQPKAKAHSFFRTSSPVSVLEDNTRGSGGSDSSSSSSSSSSWTSASYGKDAKVLLPPISPPEAPSVMAVPARARSKRPRPAAFSLRPHVSIPYLPPSSDAVTEVHPLSAAANFDPESFGESCSPPPPPKKKNSKKTPAATADGEESGSPPPVRKCMHCEIQKTPQWRAGPMGPKTLCNACGVRYKSGRLFPEYRPAASPTFVPSIHSNSHKKVVEMRITASQKVAPAGAAMSSSSDGCDLLEYIRRRE